MTNNTHDLKHIDTLAYAMQGVPIRIDLPSPWQDIYQDAEATCLIDDEANRSAAYKDAIYHHFNGDADQIWQAVSSKTVTSRSSRRKLHWAEEAFEPQPPIDWIVNGLFSAGSVSVLYGDPGTGKTYALLDMGVAVALGEDWLDHPTKQSHVLFVDEESGPRRLKRRLHQVLHSHNANKDTKLAFLSLPLFNLRDKNEATALQLFIQEAKAKLIIIDAMIDVLDGGDENIASVVQPMFRNLRTIATNEQAAFVIIHHPNRGGGYRGTSAMEGAVDLMLKVTRNNDLLTFNSEKTRDVGSFAFAAMAHFDDDNYWLARSDKQAAKDSGVHTAVRRHILKYVVENYPVTIDQIEAHPGKWAPSTVRTNFYDLKKLDCVERLDDGGQGDAGIYGPTEKGRELYTQLGLG
jgi:hypothetical protein